MKRLGVFDKILLWIGGILVLVFVVLVVPVTCSISMALRSKTRAPHASALPAPSDDSAEPILQIEDHTCGFLSLAAAYKKYGLSPDAENLRYRLGVDRPANPLDETTTGTLHPDMFRVLDQDQFRYELLDPHEPETIRVLRQHLEEKHVALLLIARRENGNLHWVLTDGMEGEELRIVDSLQGAPYTEPPVEFLDGFVLSIVTLAPASEARPVRGDPYTAGMKELEQVRRRMARRGGED